MARRDQEPARVRRVRMIIAGALAAAALLVIAVGVRFVMQPLGEVDAGQHYVALPGVDRPRDAEVVVTEYFSYGCVHCRNFDPQIEEWTASLPEGVRFERVPVAFSPAWRALSAAYYAAEELDILDRNHTRLFDAIHRTQLNLQTTDAFARFFDGHGTDGAAFRRAL
ncbi:MAG: thiol:disulfide interchange protein DsbA/DsbL, partial [Pseudomonadales bacterium]|nr:thiol:disulfide interchange protein DsbA/DsbL [Pseudomonadales bacterium]